MAWRASALAALGVMIEVTPRWRHGWASGGSRDPRRNRILKLLKSARCHAHVSQIMSIVVTRSVARGPIIDIGLAILSA